MYFSVNKSYKTHMKTILVKEICQLMKDHLSPGQNRTLENTLNQVFSNYELPDSSPETIPASIKNNTNLINLFLAAKKIEGCSDNTLKYYRNNLEKMISFVAKNVCNVETNDLRLYLSEYQAKQQCTF